MELFLGIISSTRCNLMYAGDLKLNNNIAIYGLIGDFVRVIYVHESLSYLELVHFDLGVGGGRGGIVLVVLLKLEAYTIITQVRDRRC